MDFITAVFFGAFAGGYFACITLGSALFLVAGIKQWRKKKHELSS